jgi:hypothetical protein
MGQVSKVVGEEMVPRKIVVVERTCDLCGRDESVNWATEDLQIPTDLIHIELDIRTGGHGSTFHEVLICNDCFMTKVGPGLESAGFGSKGGGTDMLSDEPPLKPYDPDEDVDDE